MRARRCAGRAKNRIAPNPHPDNEIVSGSFTTIRWLEVRENFGSSIGGLNNTVITIPDGVSLVRMNISIIYSQFPPPPDVRTILWVLKDGNANTGMGNAGYPTRQFFNSKYGMRLSTPLMPVTAGEKYEIVMRQDSGSSLYLEWGSTSSSVSFEYFAD